MPIAPGPRVLSVQQPWAWAIASGRKRIENRSWYTNYRGTVYVHASSKLDRNAVEWLRRELAIRVPDHFQQSAVVAVAQLADVITRRRARRFGKWFLGPYGFVLTNVRQLPVPVATKGKLRLFRPSPALKRNVERQLKRARGS
jgi:ASCH domain-containing protein